MNPGIDGQGVFLFRLRLVGFHNQQRLDLLVEIHHRVDHVYAGLPFFQMVFGQQGHGLVLDRNFTIVQAEGIHGGVQPVHVGVQTADAAPIVEHGFEKTRPLSQTWRFDSQLHGVATCLL